jgi:GNAT superfamily N-acetyltransferase
MLRIATIEDEDLILELALKFVNESPYKEYANEEYIRGLIKDFLASDQSVKIVLLHENSMLAGMVSPFLFGPHLMATEVAWWVDLDSRKKKIGEELLEAFEFWAKKVGCDLITMVSIDDTLGKYYEKKGYSLHERAYMKEL